MTPERLAELKRTRMFYAADASGDIAIICELLDHVATLEGYAKSLYSYAEWFGNEVPDDIKEAVAYVKARAANTPERTPHAE